VYVVLEVPLWTCLSAGSRLARRQAASSKAAVRMHHQRWSTFHVPGNIQHLLDLGDAERPTNIATTTFLDFEVGS